MAERGATADICRVWTQPKPASVLNWKRRWTVSSGTCRQNNWAGFDPYDALNSRVFALLPLSRSRYCRIALTQALKRLPVNLRPLLGISKEQNPKGLALFLTALIKLSRVGMLREDDLIESLVGRLIVLRSPNTSHWCWGYSFPWQTRTVLVPRGAPNLVCTAFVANALLDLYDMYDDARCFEMAVSAADYIAQDLYWSENTISGFSYPMPGVRNQVHNANFLASALLCRVFNRTGDKKFLEPALNAARYSAAAQAPNGSWSYSESRTQGWIDNFHTGFNLCALRSIARYGATVEFDTQIRTGFDFYVSNFFDESGAPKYFHNRKYPIDAHCVAQSIITLLALGDLADGSAGLADSVFRWAMTRMWDERGYFYYQVLPFGRNKLSYMRWSQAWMLLALSTLLESRRTIAPTVKGSTGELATVANGPAA